MRTQAVNLWFPSALVSGDAALHLYSSQLPAPPVVDVVAPYGSSKQGPTWMRIRTCAPLRVHGSPKGMACVVAERAVVDSWRSASGLVRELKLHEALWARVAPAKAVLREARRLPRVAGRRRLELLLTRFISGATSPLEAMARSTAFADPRCSDFEWQAPVTVAGRRRVADVLHRRARVVIELDGSAYHSSSAAFQRDRERDVEFAAAGFVTLRFTFRDIKDRPGWCRDRALEVVARRLPHPAGR